MEPVPAANQALSVLPTGLFARSLSDLGDRHEKKGNRGQIFENLQAHSGPMGQEFSEIWTDLPFSQ
jgi:hypothetical protein